ncbi:hypothetical protein [Streptomyces lomondensis]|uniref:DUF2867 domain-containing protein n=1 Tax=Streptomyces lomondensis TaxID=68229 RepID=A0ABQ2XCV5_9ACTN|nr:hypothetical protein [Streptomyces lomondensis]MCF0081235.1 hypothetical protein [Streptomyces lomondensis]GGX08652.1 hypothetical protein GCM10010383_43300 [Streptomyces lomondensis]
MDAAVRLSLPFVDEHTTVVAADAGVVWRELGEVLDRSFGGGRAAGYATLVGCADRTASGPRPLSQGATIPGFRVASAVPGAELVLIGRHHFSTYALIFRLDGAGPGRTRLRAETRARFPGPAGALYRQLVIGTGGHALGVRRMLTAVRRRADRKR